MGSTGFFNQASMSAGSGFMTSYSNLELFRQGPFVFAQGQGEKHDRHHRGRHTHEQQAFKNGRRCGRTVVGLLSIPSHNKFFPVSMNNQSRTDITQFGTSSTGGQTSLSAYHGFPDDSKPPLRNPRSFPQVSSFTFFTFQENPEKRLT